MQSLGIVVRNKNSTNRQELQNNSVLDSAIHKIQRILKARVKNNPTWVTHVPATMQEWLEGMCLMRKLALQLASLRLPKSKKICYFFSS